MFFKQINIALYELFCFFSVAFSIPTRQKLQVTHFVNQFSLVTGFFLLLIIIFDF
jgi:hypothetical protein